MISPLHPPRRWPPFFPAEREGEIQKQAGRCVHASRLRCFASSFVSFRFVQVGTIVLEKSIDTAGILRRKRSNRGRRYKFAARVISIPASRLVTHPE